MLAALAPDRIVLALAALGEIEQETRLIERQWSLKRERARYEAERARRQYDAVEPENRLVARSLEQVWEERLRRVDQVEQEYDAWRREQATSIYSVYVFPNMFLDISGTSAVAACLHPRGPEQTTVVTE